jgi:hypothetical protein
MPKEQLIASWKEVIGASGGSNLCMEKAYIDEENSQAICCWTAPDHKSIEELFAKANVKVESIRNVVEYK